MLKLGASKPWQDAMEALTGQRDILATPLLNYFEPLRVWLEAENIKNGDYIGWDIPPKQLVNKEFAPHLKEKMQQKLGFSPARESPSPRLRKNRMSSDIRPALHNVRL